MKVLNIYLFIFVVAGTALKYDVAIQRNQEVNLSIVFIISFYCVCMKMIYLFVIYFIIFSVI